MFSDHFCKALILLALQVSKNFIKCDFWCFTPFLRHFHASYKPCMDEFEYNCVELARKQLYSNLDIYGDSRDRESSAFEVHGILHRYQVIHLFNFFFNSLSACNVIIYFHCNGDTSVSHHILQNLRVHSSFSHSCASCVS